MNISTLDMQECGRYKNVDLHSIRSDAYAFESFH